MKQITRLTKNSDANKHTTMYDKTNGCLKSSYLKLNILIIQTNIQRYDKQMNQNILIIARIRKFT